MKTDSTHDEVISPNHYSLNNGDEVIDVIKNSMSKEMFEGFCMGNVIKYVLRHKQKGGVVDLRKALYYINALSMSELEQ